MARAGMQTMVGYQYRTPAPWPAGNCFSAVPASTWDFYLNQLQNTSWWRKYLPRVGKRTRADRGWLVVNMHAENFHAVCKQLNLKTVETEKLDDRFCLVVDWRIPRKWLLLTPKTCCAPIPMRRQLWRERPECFREDVELQALFGKTWRQSDREDSGGLIARLLPGDRIRFEPAELICSTASGEFVAQRYWQPSVHWGWGSSATRFINVYDLRQQGFSGMGMEFDQVGDTLILTPKSRVESDGLSITTEAISGIDQGRLSRVRYRLEGPGEK